MANMRSRLATSTMLLLVRVQSTHCVPVSLHTANFIPLLRLDYVSLSNNVNLKLNRI